MNRDRFRVVLCNGAEFPSDAVTPKCAVLRLDWREEHDPNVKISLPDFVRGVYHLPDRLLDLLEIASYVFAADRFLSRGPRAALEYQTWSRSIHFAIRVRDIAFWSREIVRRRLAAALCFMTGDRDYGFSFQPGHRTPPTGLFDSESFKLPARGTAVVLFSGGIDSLVGALDRLSAEPNRKICLVSHRSQTGTSRTQTRLRAKLQSLYPRRVTHYTFDCVLHKRRAIEETQRSRAFLYVSIAYTLARALSQDELFVYENGVTALSFQRRQDLLSGRASRTTHPKTIRLLSELLSEVSDAPFSIRTPFVWMTKADVLSHLKTLGHHQLLTSSVSCSRTFQKMKRQATHCGSCSQCVDRRFAAYAAHLDDLDESGLYAVDFLEEPVQAEARTTLVDYVRQAKNFAETNVDAFYRDRIMELADAADGFTESTDQKIVERVWRLCRRHGQQVLRAIKRMRATRDDPYKLIPPGSFLEMVSERQYLRGPIERFVDSVADILARGIPLAFQHNRPKDEADFNDKVSALLAPQTKGFEREHPAVRFALGHAIPDHSALGGDVFIECKYVRGNTTPSKVNEGMAADLTKYGRRRHIFFVVYDPDRSIVDDNQFRMDFEDAGHCTVRIIR